MMGINVFFDQKTKDACSDSNSKVSITKFKPYLEYPITDIQYGTIRILIEGYFYRHGFTRETVANMIFDALQSNGKLGLEAIAASITKIPGEFAIWVIDSDKIYFFNDALGRLPVYLHQNEGSCYIGRSLSALFSHTKKIADEAGILETLWCGYALGKHTFYKGLERIPGCRFVEFDCLFGKTFTKSIHALSFSDRIDHFDKTFVVGLSEKFLSACNDIANATPLPLHVSLSGGQDSRAVLAGMAKTGKEITSSSFYFQPNDYDAVIAEKLATYLNVNWQGVGIKNSNEDDDWLITLKEGLNYSGMSFIGAYLKLVASQSNKGALMLTGDGGDKVLPYLGEKRKLKSKDELVELLTNRHAIANPKLVAALVGKSLDDLKSQIYQVVNNYPESNLNDRSIRFAIMERGAKAYFEGEDRNRNFMWSTTPFYHIDFFNMAMQVPDKYKRSYKMYAQFMQALDNGLNNIPDAGGGKMGQPLFHMRKHFQEHFRSSSPQIKRTLKTMYKLFRPSAKVQFERALHQMPSQLSFINQKALQGYYDQTPIDSQLYLETIVKVFDKCAY